MRDNVVVIPTKPIKVIVRIMTNVFLTCFQEAHKGDCHTIAYNHGGTTLASGGDDNTVKLWDPRSCNLKAALTGSTQAVMCVAFSPNDEYVLGGSNDNVVRLWSVQQGRLRVRLTLFFLINII